MPGQFGFNPWPELPLSMAPPKESMVNGKWAPDDPKLLSVYGPTYWKGYDFSQLQNKYGFTPQNPFPPSPASPQPPPAATPSAPPPPGLAPSNGAMTGLGDTTNFLQSLLKGNGVLDIPSYPNLAKNPFDDLQSLYSPSPIARPMGESLGNY